MINKNDDNWCPMKSNGKIDDYDEMFITDFTSLVHSLFEGAYPNVNADELLDEFIPID